MPRISESLVVVFACAEHRADLARGDVAHFLPIPGVDVVPVAEDDAEGERCYCQEGGQ